MIAQINSSAYPVIRFKEIEDIKMEPSDLVTFNVDDIRETTPEYINIKFRQKDFYVETKYLTIVTPENAAETAFLLDCNEEILNHKAMLVECNYHGIPSVYLFEDELYTKGLLNKGPRRSLFAAIAFNIALNENRYIIFIKEKDNRKDKGELILYRGGAQLSSEEGDYWTLLKKAQTLLNEQNI